MTTDEHLCDLITDLADYVYDEHLSDEIIRSEYIRVSGHPETQLFQRETCQDTFAFGMGDGNIGILDVEDSSEWADLSAYLEHEYGLTTSQPILRQLLLSIFGKYLERLESYEDRIDNICGQITADAEDPRYEFKSFIFGIEMDSNLDIDCVQVRPRRREDIEMDIRRIDQLLPQGSVTLPDESILQTSVLEYSVDGSSNLDDQRRGHTMATFICRLLNIFVDASYSLVRTEINGKYFRTGSIVQYPENRITADYRFQVTSEDQEYLNNLYLLLHPYTRDKFDNQIFEYPLSVAYHSLQRSWEQKEAYREAIGWLLIGLESIVGSGDVSGCVALLLDATTDRFEFSKVESDLDEAFDKRSSWAHGGSLRKSDPPSLQMRVRDYLRISIVLFSYLLNRQATDSREDLMSNLEKSLEEDTENYDWLMTATVNFEIDDYLRLPHHNH